MTLRTWRTVSLAALSFLPLWSVSAAAQDRPGEVQVYVFGPDGKPRQGVGVTSGPASATTSTSGVARLSLPAGEHAVTIEVGGQPAGRTTVSVASGGVTEVIVRLGAPGERSRLNVEGGPDGPAAVKPGDVKARAPGTISGRIVEEKELKPISGARIFVRGSSESARTDPEGRFTVKVPSGNVTLAVIHPEYATETVTGIEVPENGTASVEVKMTPSAAELDAEVVRVLKFEGTLEVVQAERRDQKSVTEIISAEQIAKSGDSDAAGALKRVTGLTVVNGRYVYVRGMGERYSSSLLNGSTLPSPEPERRAVPLDLFPVGMVESVVVQKSYSPELPGDFGGGLVQIRTRGIPDGFFVTAGLSFGYTSGTTFRKGLTYKGGDHDWLGFDDGSRDLPSSVESAPPPIGLGMYSDAQLEAFGEQMSRVYSSKTKEVPLDMSFNATVGNRHEVAGGPLGWSVGLIYDSSYQTIKEEIREFLNAGGGQLAPRFDYDSESLTNNIKLGAVATAVWEPAPDHRLQITSLLVRNTRDTTQYYQGYYRDDDVNIQVTKLGWIEETLWTNQLSGKHALCRNMAGEEDLELDWRYAYSLAERSEPDRRETRYEFDPGLGSYVLSDHPSGNERLFNELNDTIQDFGLGVSIPFNVGEDRPAKLRTGINYLSREREADTRRFHFAFVGPDSSNPAVTTLPPEDAFSPPYIGANGFRFEEVTLATDSYSAEQSLFATYVMLDFPIGADLDLSGGVRLESNDQEVITFDPFDASNSIVADLVSTDLFPALNATWRFEEQMQLRGGFGRTVNRPDFRDLSETIVNTVVGGAVFRGNSRLEQCTIDHFDLRWEWFPTQEEIFSVGLFYKGLTNPIETTRLGGATPTVTLQNAKGGTNLGLELEGRKRLGFIAPELAEFYLGGNIAFIRSKVELEEVGIATETERPLQGQSPYVLNLVLGYDGRDSRTSAAVLYNVAGKRISQIGTFGLPDVYEQPFHRLDFIITHGVTENLSISLKAQNLLDDDVEFTQSGQTTNKYRLGSSFSISATVRF